MMESYPPVIQKKRSAVSSIAWGISTVLVVLIASVAGIAAYGLHIVDRKTDNLLDFAQEGIQNLPALKDALPPVLADAINDLRQPDYVDRLDVSVRIADSSGRRGWLRPVVEVHNRGDQVVSLLSLRVTVLNEDGDPVAETNEWGATPIAADHSWRGPLLPGAKRRFACGSIWHRSELDPQELRAEIEITDVRVWAGQDNSAPAPTPDGGDT